LHAQRGSSEGVQIEAAERRRIENSLRQDHAIGDHHRASA